MMVTSAVAFLSVIFSDSSAADAGWDGSVRAKLATDTVEMPWFEAAERVKVGRKAAKTSGAVEEVAVEVTSSAVRADSVAIRVRSDCLWRSSVSVRWYTSPSVY